MDPLDVPGTTRAFRVLADLIMRSSGVISTDSLDAIRLLGTGEADAHEAKASRLQALAAEQLQQLASQLPSTMLNPIRGMLEALLDGVWAELGERVQSMLVSSVYFGHSAPDGADRSGPVLGLCAAVETFIHEQLLEPALAMTPEWTIARGHLVAHFTSLMMQSPAETKNGMEEHPAIHDCELYRAAKSFQPSSGSR